MSKSLVDYGEQKSCAVTTARRLADFLGDTMVKDKGLHCQYIVAQEPKGTPVSERAIPVAIFETDAEISKYYLRKWCKMSSDVGIRSIIDWSYYKQRLSSAIQKIITIPAAMQKVSNPVPRVVHPDWLHKKVREKEDRFRQRKLVDIFSMASKGQATQDKVTVGDIEDYSTKDGSMKLAPQPLVHLYEVNRDDSTEVSCVDDQVPKNIQEPNASFNQPFLLSERHDSLGESVDRDVDYQAWLEIKKRKWKDNIGERKRRRLQTAKTTHDPAGISELAAKRSNKHGRVGSGVSAFFTNRASALVQSHWQILQLLPSKESGLFYAWVVAGGNLHKLLINVPRVFYLNSKAPITEEFPGRRVKKTLPHSRPCFHLIEVVISENQFKAESRKLAIHLADPEVEGIYETKVPLEFNAILQLGCVCKVDKAAKARSSQDAWNLNELHMKTTTECSYIEQTISFFYIYHSFSDGRAVYVVYFPISCMVTMVVVNPFQHKEISSSLLERQFREACQALSIEAPEKGNASFKVNYVQSFDAGNKLLQRTLLEYRNQYPRPAIGVIECPSFETLKSGIRILEEFPCVCVPSNSRDCSYQALGWQAMAGKISMHRCAASSQWFNERVLLSRYAHVPLGNFEPDWLLFTADVFFSRALRDQQQILWISDDGIPDLGGIYEGDTCFADEVSQPSLSYPGAYRKVAVELKIHHLAVNALLKSSQLEEIDGGSLSVSGYDMHSEHANETDYDEESSCAPAFQVLRQLVQRCVSDAVASGNVFADALLQHLYRWLCSPLSKLHDPALHRILNKFMKKVFVLLLAELRKLGANIIFANFSKIIIDTGKIELSAGRVYCECLLKTLQTRDLFEWVELEPLHFWHSLLFMDQYNYGGIQAKCSADTSVDEPEVDIVSSWNIAEQLPKATQDHFVLIVSEFLYIPWKYLNEQVLARRNINENDSCTPSITITTSETLENCVREYLRDQISNYFTDKLLRIVRDILHHFKGHNKSDTDGSSKTGLSVDDRQVHKGDAALEFIKHVCAVLALDQIVQHDILRMRKNLLKLVRVKEFAPEAQFHDPCPSFTLSNVICSYCNDCRDLDLFRDSTLLENEWRCAVPHCGQPYNREQMENALLQIVRQRERLYHLQDLECLRCRQIKAVHLAEQCPCGGSFRCTEDSSEFSRKMKVFHSIATHQKFQLLQNCISWIIEAR